MWMEKLPLDSYIYTRLVSVGKSGGFGDEPVSLLAKFCIGGEVDW